MLNTCPHAEYVNPSYTILRCTVGQDYDHICTRPISYQINEVGLDILQSVSLENQLEHQCQDFLGVVKPWSHVRRQMTHFFTEREPNNAQQKIVKLFQTCFMSVQ